jgi:predicted MFS family arabinose efflux permease
MTDVSDRRESPVAQADTDRDRWWLVVAAGLAVFMASVDMSIVNVALPAIERDLQIATSMTEWIVLAYLLPLAGLALPSGRWLDRVGQRPALVFSLAGFALASVAAGLAPNLAWLIGRDWSKEPSVRCSSRWYRRWPRQPSGRRRAAGRWG